MSRNTGSVASSDKSWLQLYAAVAVLPLVLAACGGGGGGGSPAPTPAPTPSPTPAPAPGPAPSPTIGTTWTNVSVSGAGNLTSVDYGAGHFVAVSDTGTAIVSTDAATWTPVVPLTSNVGTDTFRANVVSHLNGTLVVGGSVTSHGAVAVSTDGTTWTMGTLPAGSTPIHGVIAGTKLIGLGETGHLYVSNDGSTWSAEPVINGIPTLNAGAYGAGAYLGVGDNGYMIRSVNGTTNWGVGQVIKVNGVGVNLHGVVWTGTQFVVVGDNGAISTSADGAMWVPLKTSAISGALRSVAVASNGTIVVVGDNGIETSPDGNVWTAQNEAGAAALYGVTYGNAEFVAVGSAGAVKTSSN